MTNVWYSWGDVFNASLQDLWWGLIQFAPKLIIAILLFIIGWVLGKLVAKAFEQVFGTLKVDKLLAGMGATELFQRAGVQMNSGYFVGQLLKWFVVIIFLMPSLSLVGLEYVAMFLREDVLGFLPNIIASVFVLIVAGVVADALSKFVVAGSKAMNVSTAHMVGSLARYTIWVFAFIIALGQLGVAPAFMQILFTGIIGMFAVGGAIAFGLGGKEHASRFLTKLENDLSKKQ